MKLKIGVSLAVLAVASPAHAERYSVQQCSLQIKIRKYGSLYLINKEVSSIFQKLDQINLVMVRMLRLIAHHIIGMLPTILLRQWI